VATVTVRTKAPPEATGFAELVSVVTVSALFTASAALPLLGPYVVSPV
jgi:hypothetical protein